MPIKLDFQKIKMLRERKNLSQAEAAKLASLKSRQHWHVIESGDSTNVTLSTLSQIADALGVKARDLLK